MSDMPVARPGQEADRPVPERPNPRPPGGESAAPETPAPEPTGSMPPLAAAAKRPRLKPFRMPLALFAVGLVLLTVGLALYPRRTAPTAPATAKLFVDPSCPLFGITYAVFPVPGHSGVTKISLRLELPSFPPPGTKPCIQSPVVAGLDVQPPDGIKIVSCSRCNGRARMPLIFPPKSREVDYVFFIKATRFGVASNGLTASVAFPEIDYLGQGTPKLFVIYRVPSVSSYDWSDPPDSISKSASTIVWNEPMAIGETPGRVEGGTDQGALASDTLKTFVAGGLIALAGAAILTAITEAVHTRDWETIRALRSK
jgi:hypothetical protein